MSGAEFQQKLDELDIEQLPQPPVPLEKAIEVTDEKYGGSVKLFAGTEITDASPGDGQIEIQYSLTKINL